MNNSSAEKKTATHSEKQYRATATVCATTYMDIHPPRGKTGASWEHTNTRSARDRTSKVTGASPQHDPNLEEGRGTHLFIIPAHPEPSNLTLVTRPYHASSHSIPPHIEITLHNKARM